MKDDSRIHKRKEKIKNHTKVVNEICIKNDTMYTITDTYGKCEYKNQSICYRIGTI